MVTFWIGGFLFFYGMRSFRVGLFPVLFLFFLTPIPSVIVETFILILQIASTEISHLFFRLTGVPLLREGFVFHLPGMSIEVAKQCSGIRSSIALVITSIIAGQLFLQTGWRKIALVLSIFPITVFKNGLRIVMLSLLGAYVDPRILGSELHKSGGIPFFVIALALLAPVLWYLRRSERKREQGLRSKD
jgi:exosortase